MGSKGSKKYFQQLNWCEWKRNVLADIIAKPWAHNKYCFTKLEANSTFSRRESKAHSCAVIYNLAWKGNQAGKQRTKMLVPALIANLWFTKILTWLWRFLCYAISRRDLSTKKTKTNIEKWPESLRVMLEF